MHGWTRDVPGAAQHRNHHGDGRWIVPFSTSGAIASVLGAQASGFYVVVVLLVRLVVFLEMSFHLVL